VYNSRSEIEILRGLPDDVRVAVLFVASAHSRFWHLWTGRALQAGFDDLEMIGLASKAE
jgi:hypothetical protein